MNYKALALLGMIALLPACCMRKKDKGMKKDMPKKQMMKKPMMKKQMPMKKKNER